MTGSNTKINTIKSFNPATKELLGELPVFGKGHVTQTVGFARRAFEDWQLLDYAARGKKIAKLRKVISDSADELAELISKEVGKPKVEVYGSELLGVLDTCTWLCQQTEEMLKDQLISLSNPFLSSKQSVIAFEPLGVIGIISPWNYPFSIPMMTILMAVMVGNTVVLKPSEKSSLIGVKIGDLFKKADFPDGVVNVITGDATTGKYLSEERLARLIFTGSVAGGKKVMAQAADSLISVTLELGGKDAAIVLPDAPSQWTAQGIVWGAFTNAGQACASIERVFVLKGKNTDEFLKALEAETKKIRLGPATDPSTDVGPIIDEEQLNKIEEQVNKAVSDGATIVVGGKARPDLGGYFFEPTLITNVNTRMDIMKNETFGPVLPVMVIESEDEVVDLVNRSKYGLTASVWGKNLSRCEAIARDLEVGTVYINDCLFSHAQPQLPWGGMKASGFGRSHSKFGLMDLVNIKHISIDAPGGGPRPWWYPYTRARTAMLRGGLNLMHGSTIGARFKGFGDFISNFFDSSKK